MQDVKDCSILIIAHIAGASETPFYLAALVDKKLFPMWAMECAADERAVPDIVHFVNTALRKASRPSTVDPGDAYVSGVRYLARIGAPRAALTETNRLLGIAWPRLPEAITLPARRASRHDAIGLARAG